MRVYEWHIGGMVLAVARRGVWQRIKRALRKRRALAPEIVPFSGRVRVPVVRFGK